jgi:hypothetical protein
VTALLDVNTLVALAWPNHVHHDEAARWFRNHRDDGWATCPLTESGFVRVCANPRISGGTVTPGAAIELLARLRRMGDHSFWEDGISIVTSEYVPRDRLHGYAQVADAHLVALARARGGTLVTFDRGILDLVPDPSSITVLTQ